METTLAICLIIACIVIIVQHIIIRKSYSDLEGLKESFTNIRKKVDEYGKIETEYNELVDTYNGLLEEHKNVIETHNDMLDDFKKSRNYVKYLADINEYLLSIHSFNTQSSKRFEEFLQDTSEKYGVENIIKKEENENE